MVALAHAEAELRIRQATTTLVCTQPFFACMLFRLRKRADPAAKTLWTDGTYLGYNPSYVLEIGRDELVGVLAHEVMHVAGLHPWRQQGRDNGAWNVACDQVVNAIVTEAGLMLPAGCIPGVSGKSAEELYVPPTPAPEGGGGGNENAQPGTANPNASQSSPSATGGGTHSPPADSAPDPLGCGEVRAPIHEDGRPLSEAEHNQQVREAKIAVQQALVAAQRAGNVPAGLERFVDEALEPQVPWKEILARFLDDQSRHDYSWTRPNRRFLGGGVIMPSLWSPAYGRVVMGCDTSGSMSKDALREVCGEILGAMEAYMDRGQSPELTVAWFDHAVYEQVVEEPEELQPRGGGGTSFGVVFAWLAQQEEPPRAIVMVTDGWCHDYGTEPGIPVLWVLTRKNTAFKPPFGELTYTLHE
jgi:predicted metal-dependent peptidase